MMFCANQDIAKGLEFVDFSGAYSHYFTAGEYLERHSYAIQNITRRNCISRHIVHRTAFDSWLELGQDGEAAVKAAQTMMKNSWTGEENPSTTIDNLVERILFG